MGHHERSNLLVTVVEEESQFQGKEHIFNRIRDKNFPKLKKDIPTLIQRMQITYDEKRNSRWCITAKLLYAQKKNNNEVLKAAKEKLQSHIKENPSK